MIRDNSIWLLFIFMFGLFNILGAQDENFDYENWPGKNGVIRGSIELPINSFLGYGLQLKPGFNDSTLRFDLPISGNDTAKIGKLEIKIFKTIKVAQLSLLDFLYAIQSPFKPPRLTSEEFSPGDVAFGSEKNEIFLLVFVRANVRVIIRAPADVAEEIAQKIDSLIQAAPVWASGDLKPHFIITMEFVKAFSVKTP